MTDAASQQVAIVAVARDQIPPSESAQSRQLLLVAVAKENPPPAGGALANQIAVISVSREFVIPITYLPYSLGGFLQTMPYYVGAF